MPVEAKPMVEPVVDMVTPAFAFSSGTVSDLSFGEVLVERVLIIPGEVAPVVVFAPALSSFEVVLALRCAVVDPVEVVLTTDLVTPLNTFSSADVGLLLTGA